MTPPPIQNVSHTNRRLFLGGACGLAAGAATLPLAACGDGGSAAASSAAQIVAAAPSAAATATTPEQDVLNFALNLHYLGAQFYAFASAGAGVAASLLTGSGTAGAAVGARAVAFADPGLARAVADIATDKLASLTAVRAVLATAAVAQPQIDLSDSAGGAFSSTAQAAGIVAAGAAFDTYASDDAFLLSASMFEDAIAAAHRATLPLLSASPGGLAAQTTAASLAAYHAGVVRSALDARAIDRPDMRARRLALVGLGAKLDPASGAQQVAAVGEAVTDIPDGEGGVVPYARSAQRTLRVLYAYAGAASAGGFFPGGINGVIRASA